MVFGLEQCCRGTVSVRGAETYSSITSGVQLEPTAKTQLPTRNVTIKPTKLNRQKLPNVTLEVYSLFEHVTLVSLSVILLQYTVSFQVVLKQSINRLVD